MSKRPNLTKEFLLHIFDYNAEEGRLYWKNTPKLKKIGKPAGSIHRGYMTVEIQTYYFFAHRIIYFLEYGRWPKITDHINGVKDDNRISNLREVTNRQNCLNRKAHRSGKLAGASYDKRFKKWVARAQINGTRISFGYFRTKTEAHKAYIKELKERGLL